MSEVTSLFYPENMVKIGQYQFCEGIEIEVCSDQASYFDWAKVRIIKQLEDIVTINKFDGAEILMGYNGNMNSIFAGYVLKTPEASENKNEIMMKDDMVKLEQIVVTNTFIDVEPQEIIEYCLRQAGIGNLQLFDQRYAKKGVVSIREKNVIAILEEVKKLWGIEYKFYFVSRTFYFGKSHEQAKIYTFEYGNNIIDIHKEGDLWMLETASAPFIRHSEDINIVHPDLSGTYKAKKVVFTTNEAGFVRTKIYF